MTKALFTYPYDEERIKRVEDLGYEVKVIERDDLNKEMDFSDIEVLVCNNPFDNIKLEKMDSLRFIQLISMGVERAPLGKIDDLNITLANARGGFSPAIAEWIIAKVLEIYKKSRFYYRNQLKKEWEKDREIYELYDKTVLFLGTGSIAKEAARRVQAFEAGVFGVNTDGRAVEFFDDCYSNDELEEVLPVSDIVVVSLPLTDKTRGLLDHELMKKMNDQSVLVNIARGEIIVEEDLIYLLKQDKFMGVALDVFAEEPLPAESPLWEMEDVIISPHVSYASEYRFERVFKIVYENLRRYIKNEPLENVVDLEKGY